MVRANQALEIQIPSSIRVLTSIEQGLDCLFELYKMSNLKKIPIVVIGDSGTGKSCLLLQFVDK